MMIFSEHGQELRELVRNVDNNVREVMTLMAFARRYMTDSEDERLYDKMRSIFLALEGARVELKECYEAGYIGNQDHKTRFFTMKDGEFQEVTKDEFPTWENNPGTDIF